MMAQDEWRTVHLVVHLVWVLTLRPFADFATNFT